MTSRVVVVLGRDARLDAPAVARDAGTAGSELVLLCLGFPPATEQTEAVDAALAAAGGGGIASVEAAIVYTVADAAARIRPEDRVVLALPPSEEAQFEAAMRLRRP